MPPERLGLRVHPVLRVLRASRVPRERSGLRAFKASLVLQDRPVLFKPDPLVHKDRKVSQALRAPQVRCKLGRRDRRVRLDRLVRKA